MDKLTHHTASVSGGNPVDQSTPDVEVSASTTIWICPTSIALLSTSIDVVPVKEDKAHILNEIINNTQ